MNYRVGSVPYLNAVPLVAKMPEAVTVDFAVPSSFPAKLGSGELDAVLVSSIEALRRPDARVAAGVSISSLKWVNSVRLFSQVPLGEIKSLVLDQSSLTSNALVQILLAELFGLQPTTCALPPDLPSMLTQADAALLIGDNGMRADGSNLHVMDLGEAWSQWTGLPFVWAMWLGHDRLTPELAGLLLEAKTTGCREVESLVPSAVDRFGFSENLTREYLSWTMNYDLGPPHFAALTRFGELAQKWGLIDAFQLPKIVSANQKSEV